MKQRNFFIMLGVVFLTASIFLFGDTLQISIERARGTMNSVLSSPLALISSLSGGRDVEEAMHQLLIENETLKEKILALEKGNSLVSESRMRSAHVFSTYPFNHRHVLTIDKGADAGFMPEWGVAAEGSFLLGKISSVASYTSAVQTIFDGEMTLPVKIGQSGAHALLVGGRIPRLTLIDKNVTIIPGDDVYAADAHFPHGLRVGAVGKITIQPGSAFQEAILEVPYEVSEIGSVTVFVL